MSYQEIALLKQLKISHQVVAHALGKRRQTITRGLALDPAYLSADDLKKIATYLEEGDRETKVPPNPDLARRFREQVTSLSPAGQAAFSPEETKVKSDPMFLEMRQSRAALSREGLEQPANASPFYDAKELWIFRSRPQETEHPSHLEWMRRWYYDPLPSHERPPTRRLVYFSSPAWARWLGRYLLEIFGGLEKDENRIHVIVIESRALSIVPDYVIVNPLDDPQAWAAGQNDYGNVGWIRLAQKNVDLILDNLRSAGIAGFTDRFFVEAFNDDSDDSRSIPRFTLRFDSKDLDRSRSQLAMTRPTT